MGMQTHPSLPHTINTKVDTLKRHCIIPKSIFEVTSWTSRWTRLAVYYLISPSTRYPWSVPRNCLRPNMVIGAGSLGQTVSNQWSLYPDDFQLLLICALLLPLLNHSLCCIRSCAYTHAHGFAWRSRMYPIVTFLFDIVANSIAGLTQQFSLRSPPRCFIAG